MATVWPWQGKQQQEQKEGSRHGKGRPAWGHVQPRQPPLEADPVTGPQLKLVPLQCALTHGQGIILSTLDVGGGSGKPGSFAAAQDPLSGPCWV